MVQREELGEVVVLVQNDNVIQVTLLGRLQTQQVVNVFHFRIFTTSGGLFDVTQAVQDWIVDFDASVLSLLSAGLVYDEVKAINLSNPIQILEIGISALGGKAGETLPIHDTVSVKLLRTTGITRNGRKAYSGIVEADNANGGLLYTPAEVTQLEDFHSTPFVWTDPDNPSFELTLTPVIVGRTLNAQNVYELDLSKINVIRGAVIAPRVRTQNTRKT